MNTFETAKKRLAPCFLDCGLVPIKSKRLWIEDCGFYLIMAEIQPCKGLGFAVNVGVRFLWSDTNDLVYDYSDGECRIVVPCPIGIVCFDSPRYEEEFAYVQEQVVMRVQNYRSLKNMDTLLHKLVTRHDLASQVNRGFKERDMSCGIAKMLTGDSAGAKYLLGNDAQDNQVAERLHALCDDRLAFEAELLATINHCRKLFEQRLHIKFPALQELAK